VPFACLLTVRLPEGRRLGSEERSITVTYRGTELRIKPLRTQTFSEAEWLSVRARGFQTGDDAREFGRDLKGHLRLAAVDAHIGIDVGTDEVVSWPGPPIVDAARERGVQMLPGVHGVLVFEETTNDRVMWGMAGGIVSGAPEKLFVDALTSAERLLPAIDQSALGLACDLVSLLDFETSDRARFVALVTAVEALAETRPPSSELLRDLAEKWIGELEHLDTSDLDQRELESFAGRLRDLKEQSIKRSIRALVEQCAPGEEADVSHEEFVARCYDARSALVHGATDIPNVRPLVVRLRKIVGSVIRAVAER
jgi:hypothetical protein